MKKINLLILTVSLVISLKIYAQQKAGPGLKIVMEFVESNPKNSKTYECYNVYYKYDRTNEEEPALDYTISISLTGIPDSKQLEWIANPKMLKTVKITTFRLGKKEREYLLQNASLLSYSDSLNEIEGEETGSQFYDLLISAEQIYINSIKIKKTK